MVGGSLSFVLLKLTKQGQAFTLTTNKIQKLNSLIEELNRQQYKTEFNVMSYRFKQDKVYLDAITQADLGKARVLDEMSGYITTPFARELVKAFIEANIDVLKTRSELINAIQENDAEKISINFNKWSLQIQNIRSALADVNAFNINSIEGTIVSANQLRGAVAKTLIGLIVIIIFGSLLLYWFFTKFVILPIRALAKATEEISRADFTNTANISTLIATSNDEIGQLTSSFKTMAVKLRASYKGLEQKVKERTKKLEEAKSKDEAILSSIGEGLIVTDRNGLIVLINGTFKKILDFDPEDLQGKPLVDALEMVDENGKQVEKTERLIFKLLHEKITTTISDNNLQYKRKDGVLVPVSVTVSPMMLGDSITGAVVVFRDITKEKQIDKTKTEFVSLASHQLRTPLSSVNWYTEMLLAGDAGKINAEQKKYLDEIYIGNQRMVALVNALLNVSRLELGTFSVEPLEMDLIETAQSVIAELKPQIITRKLKVKETHTGVPKIVADPKLMRIVIQNLLSNAVKYTPEKGTVTVDIRQVKKADTVDTVKAGLNGLVITVSDSGYGVPDGDKDKIFSKLFRAENVREMDTEGTGLGLYIVKSIIDQAGGKVWFESKLNKGTTFYVLLPFDGMKKKKGVTKLE